MSKGPWLLVAGVILLATGGGLFAGFAFGLIGGFVPTIQEVSRGAYANTTVALREGETLTYFVGIDNYSAGDEVTVFLRLPEGATQGRTTVRGEELAQTYRATVAGEHLVVVQNTGPEAVVVLTFAAPLDPLAGVWVLSAFLSAVVGFVALVVGIIFTAAERRSARQT